MEDDTRTRQLNAIVGAAVRALAESGAGDESIGAFAAQHRKKVADILGCPDVTLQPPSLEAIIQQAVAMALEQADLPSRQRTGRKTERINVEIRGRRTSLTISKDITVRLCQLKGNRRVANAFIKEMASNVPSDIENRSAWVEERILAYLDFQGRQDPAGGVRSQH